MCRPHVQAHARTHTQTRSAYLSKLYNINECTEYLIGMIYHTRNSYTYIHMMYHTQPHRAHLSEVGGRGGAKQRVLQEHALSTAQGRRRLQHPMVRLLLRPAYTPHLHPALHTPLA